LNESDGGKLSEDELVATVVLLLNAGHEATGNGVKTLIERGIDAREAFASESRSAAAVELLRLDPLLLLFARYALGEVEFASVRLRKR
jgi:unspecific monooxygenase